MPLDVGSKRVGEIVREVCDAVVGYDLMTAEVVVFEATLARLMCIFSGDTIDEVARKARLRPKAVEISRLLEGLSAAEIVWIHGHVRLMNWPAHFALMPDTRFGQDFQTCMERAARDDAKPN
jgi:hypothetical protein